MESRRTSDRASLRLRGGTRPLRIGLDLDVHGNQPLGLTHLDGLDDKVLDGNEFWRLLRRCPDRVELTFRLGAQPTAIVPPLQVDLVTLLPVLRPLQDAVQQALSKLKKVWDDLIAELDLTGTLKTVVSPLITTVAEAANGALQKAAELAIDSEGATDIVSKILDPVSEALQRPLRDLEGKVRESLAGVADAVTDASWETLSSASLDFVIDAIEKLVDSSEEALERMEQQLETLCLTIQAAGRAALEGIVDMAKGVVSDAKNALTQAAQHCVDGLQALLKEMLMSLTLQLFTRVSSMLAPPSKMITQASELLATPEYEALVATHAALTSDDPMAEARRVALAHARPQVEPLLPRLGVTWAQVEPAL
eukprot:6123292-Prymnesium_polylepis.1